MGMRHVMLAAAAATCSVAANAAEVAPSCTDASRACMIAAATSYLEGVVAHDGSKVPFAPDARRTEQGNDTGQGSAVLRAALGRMPLMLGYDDARFFVDEQTGNVVVFALLRLVIEQPAPLLSEPGKSSVPGPITVHLAERFKVEKGLIKEIEAIFYKRLGTSEGASGWSETAP